MSFLKMVMVCALFSVFALMGCDPGLMEEAPEIDPEEAPEGAPERDAPLIDLQDRLVAVVCNDGQPEAAYRESSVLLQTYEIFTGEHPVYIRNVRSQGYFIANEEFYPWNEVEFSLSEVQILNLELGEELAAGEIYFQDFTLVQREFDTSFHRVERFSSTLLGLVADTEGSPNSIGSEYLSSLKTMDFVFADTGYAVPQEAIFFRDCFDPSGLGANSSLAITNIPL